MKKFMFAILFSFILIKNSFAQIANTAWSGDGRLTRNGNELCSGGTALTIQKGGEDWIWPIVTNGCGTGWMLDYMPLQIVGSDLKDRLGFVVGNVTDTLLQAKNFLSFEKDLNIIELKFDMENSETAEISIKFKNDRYPGIFEYKAKLNRYRDSIWH